MSTRTNIEASTAAYRANPSQVHAQKRKFLEKRFLAEIAAWRKKYLSPISLRSMARPSAPLVAPATLLDLVKICVRFVGGASSSHAYMLRAENRDIRAALKLIRANVKQEEDFVYGAAWKGLKNRAWPGHDIEEYRELLHSILFEVTTEVLDPIVEHGRPETTVTEIASRTAVEEYFRLNAGDAAKKPRGRRLKREINAASAEEAKWIKAIGSCKTGKAFFVELQNQKAKMLESWQDDQGRPATFQLAYHDLRVRELVYQKRRHIAGKFGLKK